MHERVQQWFVCMCVCVCVMMGILAILATRVPLCVIIWAIEAFPETTACKIYGVKQ